MGVDVDAEYKAHDKDDEDGQGLGFRVSTFIYEIVNKLVKINMNIN